MPLLVWSAVHTSSTAACRDSYTPNYIGSMYRSGSRSSSASWCSTVCTTKHPSTSSTSASLSPVLPPINIFALSAEVFSSCLGIAQQLWSAGFYCGWPCDMELVTRQSERSGHQQRLLQTFTEDVFIFSLLMCTAHYSFLDDALYKLTYLLTYIHTNTC